MPNQNPSSAVFLLLQVNIWEFVIRFLLENRFIFSVKPTKKTNDSHFQSDHEGMWKKNRLWVSFGLICNSVNTYANVSRVAMSATKSLLSMFTHLAHLRKCLCCPSVRWAWAASKTHLPWGTMKRQNINVDRPRLIEVPHQSQYPGF